MKALKVLGIIFACIIVVGAAIMITLRLTGGDEDAWICVGGEWVKHGNPDTLPPLEPCLTEEEKNTAIANPASVNCENQGGKLEIRENIMGGQYGMCIFENGKECEEWSLFRGECASTTAAVEPAGRRNASTTLELPSDSDLITSPVTIQGSMPGNWYFEANAIAELYDANGKKIGQSSLAAQGEWMTTSVVPFVGTLEFSTPETATGTLVLRNDNPSDLRENDRQESYSVVFGTKIKVYFGNSEKDPGALDCEKVFAVERVVAKTPDIARAALNELLKGVSQNEGAEKYFTSINDGVVVQKLTIENGVAKADFNSILEEMVGGSCRVQAIGAQIASTLKQFASVKDVIISIDGRTEDVLQP